MSKIIDGINFKLNTRAGYISMFLAFFMISPGASAATSPGLGMAGTFDILSSTYTNTTPGTTISGDLGYTTGPATPATVGGTIHSADTAYNQAGIDQNSALSLLASQPCTFNFANGAVDLSTDVTHGPVGVYTPGVYCITGAATTVAGSTITLTGAGTYIFRINGALTTAANTTVTGSGASSCDVWWTPTAATTLGANSTFFGTVLDASGITIGNTVTWAGSGLAFGGTVSTSSDTITGAVCGASRTAAPGGPVVPGLPNTGNGPASNFIAPWTIPAGLVVILGLAWLIYKKRNFPADI
jgi:hypothetical protein